MIKEECLIQRKNYDENVPNKTLTNNKRGLGGIQGGWMQKKKKKKHNITLCYLLGTICFAIYSIFHD